jgi:hypothetical protein
MASKRDEAQTLLDSAVPEGVEIRSNRDSATFARLTNTTHETLVANWKTGGIMSACNGFVGWYAGKLEITGIYSFFKLEDSLRKIGKGHAWVPADGTADPKTGDILHHTKGGTGLHVDVCVGFASGRRLIRAAAGQITFQNPRNPAAEFDVLKRVTGDKPYDFHNLLGWLDIERFFEAAPGPDEGPTINWVIGWWDVNDGEQYYYYFGTDGHVQYTKNRPVSMFAPPKVPLSSGEYSFRPNNVVFIRWNPLDGGSTEETFTADGGRKAMKGRSSRYGPLVALRL